MFAEGQYHNPAGRTAPTSAMAAVGGASTGWPRLGWFESIQHLQSNAISAARATSDPASRH
jgi:hypothetical protein